MKQEQLEKLRAWFDDYTACFYADDEYVNANLKLKEDHSRRVCQEMRYLTESLGLDASQRRMAEVIALLHDIGRFEQFVEYRTYNDPRSVNHCVLGLKALRRTKALESVVESEKQIIEKAIECHGSKQLPTDLGRECLLFAKLIRDADKLDIFRVMIQNYTQYRVNPEDFMFEVELPDVPGYSPGVIEDILHGRRVDYHRLQTLNDMKLLNIGWVYDVNFPQTLRRLMDRKFLQMLFDLLPQTLDIQKVRKKIFDFVRLEIDRTPGNSKN